MYMLGQDGDWSLLYSLGVPKACSDTVLVVPELLDVLLTTRSPTDTCRVPKVGSYYISYGDSPKNHLNHIPKILQTFLHLKLLFQIQSQSAFM